MLHIGNIFPKFREIQNHGYNHGYSQVLLSGEDLNLHWVCSTLHGMHPHGEHMMQAQNNIWPALIQNMEILNDLGEWKYYMVTIVAPSKLIFENYSMDLIVEDC